MRRATVILAVTFASLIRVSPAIAQENIGPKAGTWAAEGTTNTASLLRFRSPTSAWILSASILYLHEEDEISGPTPSSTTDDAFSVQMSVGLRTYRRPEERIRPFTTLRAIAGYRNDFARGWSVGGAGDVGAAYFFSSHVSLGVSGALNVIYEQLERDAGFGNTLRDKTLVARFDGFRLLGAVYF
jgi:hypothetical protein